MSLSKPYRTAGVAAGALALAVVASACSLVSSDSPEDRVVGPPPSVSTPTPPIVNDPAPAPAPQPAPAPAAPAGLLAPGESTTSSGNVPFVNFDDQVAVFSHQVTGVRPALAGERAELEARSSNLAGSDIYFIDVASYYVSGAALAYSSFSGNFKPIAADRSELQTAALIGYDFCSSDSIPSPGNDPSALIPSCVVAIVPAGSPAPAGVLWSDIGTEYDRYDGAPAYFFLS